MVAPLFVIHGANDPRVPLSEAEQIKAALDGKGVDCELRVYDDEGHGLAKRANRLDAYPAAIEFLVQHLSVPLVEEGAPVACPSPASARLVTVASATPDRVADREGSSANRG